MHAHRAGLALALVFGIPVASAGGSLSSPVLVVGIHDDFDGSCAPRVAGFCFVNTTATSNLGEGQADARIRMEYVFAATNFTRLESATGDQVLLPDESLRVNLRDVVIRHRLLYEIADALALAPENPAAALVDVQYSPQAVTIHYWGVDSRDLAGGLGPQRQEFGMGGNVGADQVGPVNDQGEAASDEAWAYPGAVACPRAPHPACGEAAGTVELLAREATPNLLYGFRVETAEAATSPGALRGPIAEAAPREEAHRASASPLAWGAPAAPLARAAPAEPIPLARAPPSSAPAAPHARGPGPDAPVARHELLARSREDPATLRGAVVAAVATAVAGMGFALVALYRRIHDRDLPRQATRARLLQIVRATPGIRASHAAAQLAVRPHAVQYHAARLARAGALVVRSHAGQSRLFPASASAPTEDEYARALTEQHPVARALLDAVPPYGSIPRARVLHAATARGTPPRTAQWHLARLLAHGWLTRDAGPDGPVLARAPSPLHAERTPGARGTT